MARPHKKLAMIQSTLIRASGTTAYSQNDLIASSATAGSLVVPQFGLAAGAGLSFEFFEITRGILYTNLTTGFTTFQGHIDLWGGAPPTFTNGDNGAYAVATGAANYLGCLTTEISSAYKVAGDGTFLDAKPGVAFVNGASAEQICFPLNDALPVFWSLREIDATGFTPITLQAFTLKLFGNVE